MSEISDQYSAMFSAIKIDIVATDQDSRLQRYWVANSRESLILFLSISIQAAEMANITAAIKKPDSIAST